LVIAMGIADLCRPMALTAILIIENVEQE